MGVGENAYSEDLENLANAPELIKSVEDSSRLDLIVYPVVHDLTCNGKYFAC